MRIYHDTEEERHVEMDMRFIESEFCLLISSVLTRMRGATDDAAGAAAVVAEAASALVASIRARPLKPGETPDESDCIVREK